MGSLISNDSCLINDLSFLLLIGESSVCFLHSGSVTLEEKFFNLRREFLCPEFFSWFKAIGLRTLDESDLTCIFSLDVDTFIMTKLNVLSFLDDLNINGRNKLTWTFNDKTFSRGIIFTLCILVVINGSDEKVLVFIQYIGVLDTLFKSFSWEKEEALFSLSEFLDSPLILSVFSNWIEDNAVLS